MSGLTDQLNKIAARWEHGHNDLTDGCALCNDEWAEVYTLIHGPATIPTTDHQEQP